jgi:hypothetical protein
VPPFAKNNGKLREDSLMADQHGWGLVRSTENPQWQPPCVLALRKKPPRLRWGKYLERRSITNDNCLPRPQSTRTS